MYDVRTFVYDDQGFVVSHRITQGLPTLEAVRGTLRTQSNQIEIEIAGLEYALFPTGSSTVEESESRGGT